MNALPNPFSAALQIVAALIAGVVLSVFGAPTFADLSADAVGTGGSGGIHPGPADSCVSPLCLDGQTGSGGNVGTIPESGWTGTGGSGGSGGIHPGPADSCISLLCLDGQTGSGGTIPESDWTVGGSGGSGGIYPGAPADGFLLGGGTAGGSGGNTN